MTMTEKKPRKSKSKTDSIDDAPKTKADTLSAEAMTPLPEPELTPVEKVEIMNGLAMAVRDASVRQTLVGTDDNPRPSGELVYKVFVDAMNDKISEIMDGKAGLPPQANTVIGLMNQVSSVMAQINNTMQQIQSMMRGWATNPVSQTINLLCSKLGGEQFHFDAPSNDAAVLQAQQLQQQQIQHAQQANQTGQKPQPQYSRQQIEYESQHRSGDPRPDSFKY